MARLKAVCLSCGRSHSIEEYRENRFCRGCGAFLSLRRGSLVKSPGVTPLRRAGEKASNYPYGTYVQRDPLDYGDLFQAHETYERLDYNRAYDEARRADWRHMHEFSDEEVRNVVLRFLNRWLCRLSCDVRLVRSIKAAYTESAPLFEALTGKTLEEVESGRVKRVRDRDLSNREVIRCLFERFCGVRYRFGEVATSKTLHMALPRLVVMRDNGIARGYGLHLDACEYAYRFMPLMKALVNEAINGYMQAHRCHRSAAINDMTVACHGRTLAKMIDEYNWLNRPRRIV